VFQLDARHSEHQSDIRLPPRVYLQTSSLSLRCCGCVIYLIPGIIYHYWTATSIPCVLVWDNEVRSSKTPSALIQAQENAAYRHLVTAWRHLPGVSPSRIRWDHNNEVSLPATRMAVKLARQTPLPPFYPAPFARCRPASAQLRLLGGLDSVWGTHDTTHTPRTCLIAPTNPSISRVHRDTTSVVVPLVFQIRPERRSPPRESAPRSGESENYAPKRTFIRSISDQDSTRLILKALNGLMRPGLAWSLRRRHQRG
jgi:hypothetical protein